MGKLKTLSTSYDNRDVIVYYAADKDHKKRWKDPEISDRFLEGCLGAISEMAWRAIDANAGLHKLPETIALLNAHGCVDDNKRWIYDTGSSEMALMDLWIATADSRHSLIYVAVCNPSCAPAYTRKSSLIIPSNTFSLERLKEGGGGDYHCSADLFIPGYGFMADDAEFENVAESLEGKID